VCYRMFFSRSVNRALMYACLPPFARSLARWPKQILEVVPSLLPRTMGTQDAVKPGMGGVHCVPLVDGTIGPTLWHAPFALITQAKLVLFANPKGTIANSNLELAASVATHDVLAQRYDVSEANIHNFTDNMATFWCQRKGAT
jgi:hypothetical protein